MVSKSLCLFLKKTPFLKVRPLWPANDVSGDSGSCSVQPGPGDTQRALCQGHFGLKSRETGEHIPRGQGALEVRAERLYAQISYVLLLVLVLILVLLLLLLLLPLLFLC